MRAIAAALLLWLPGTGSGDSPLSAQCSEQAAQQRPASVPALLPGSAASVVFDAVRCELENGNIDEITFLADGTALVVLGNGERIELSIPSTRGASFTAEAVARGVTIHAARTVTIAAGTTRTGGNTNPLGVVTLSVVVLLAVAWIAWWWRTRRRVTIPLGGVRRSERRKGGDVPTTSFSDVAGCAEAVEDLREIVDCLRNPDAYLAAGARAPRGALLVGPPGTGKTLLARAVAGEAGVPFYPMAGSDFVETYVGVGARRVRDVFAKARRDEHAIVFIDEIDAVGRKRGESPTAGGGEQEMENTLVALLNELDGFRQTGVVVLAATNRPEVLDPALCRPGRLDRRVHVPLPDRDEREKILGIHTRGKRLDAGVDLRRVAGRAAGMSGAQLEQVCNEAALLAARERRSLVTEKDMDEALEYVCAGRPRRSASVTDDDRRVAAWHEAGHLVASLRQPGADRPAGASITPRGQAGGVTWTVPGENVIVTRESLLARLVVALAGRAAEEFLLGGEYTAGAADDLARASELATTMVDRLGMTRRGLRVRATGSTDSDDVAEELLQEAAANARRLLEDNEELLRASVHALLSENDLDAEAIARLDTAHPARTPAPACTPT